MSATNGLVREFPERKESIRATVMRAGRRRVQQAAEDLSRRGLAAASAELVNEAMERFIGLCYEADTDGALCNVDAPTGRILIPVPWSRLGYQRYGLRGREHLVLRRRLLDLQEETTPLFVWNAGTRRWYLALGDYPAAGYARPWWLKFGELSAADWRNIERRVRRR